MTGREVFENMGVTPDDYLCLNIATTGVKEPIGVLEISGRFGLADHDFQYFLSPDDMVVPSDLNHAYTRIPRYLYDKEVTGIDFFLSDMVPFMRERPPSIVIINSDWWLQRLSKSKSSRMLSPFFACLGRHPIFSVSFYEKARVGMDYTVFTRAFEYCHELIKDIKRVKTQAPREYACDVDCGYDSREGEEFNTNKMTSAQEEVRKMVYIWNNILDNNEAEERHV